MVRNLTCMFLDSGKSTGPFYVAIDIDFRNYAAQFRYFWLGNFKIFISEFLICAAQFRNCVNLQIARNIYIHTHMYISYTGALLQSAVVILYIVLLE